MTIEALIIVALTIFALIIINGFFSSAEIAIISAKRAELEKLYKDGNHSAGLVMKLKDDPDRLLATVQIGVTVVSTLASVIGGIASSEFLKPHIEAIGIPALEKAAEAISVVIVVALISYVTLVVGELAPKTIALRYAERIACFSARPIDYLSKITSFFVKILTLSNQGLLKTLGIKTEGKKAFVSEEDIRYFIREGKATGIFEETEAQLLHGVFEFADATVKEVMVPKHKFSAIEIHSHPSELLKYITETGFSRYPVYDETLDKIIGVIYNKDVIRAVEAAKPFTVAELLRSPYFVPNSVMISRLLREMQRRKVHIAIVVDEHGDIDGLVTIEDLLEEIVGEIEDEYDTGKGGILERLRDGTLIIDASASLRDIEDAGIHIDDDGEEYHTLAGFMLAKLQRIPRGGEFVIYKNMRFTVVDVEVNRIVKVKVEQLNNARKPHA